MKIRTRLTIRFTILVATLLLVTFGAIYWTSAKSRETEFYRELEKEAITKANLFLETEIKPQTLHAIYHNNRRIINEVEVAVYDTEFNLLYHDAVEIDRVKETREMIDTIKKTGQHRFYQDDWQVVGILYTYKGVDYVVTATSYDEYGYNKLANLLTTIVVLSLVSVVLIFVIGRFFSKKALHPVKKMIEEANQITATSLDLRLKLEKNKDELHDLATTFNQMLDRLELSFDAQKQFVSNISHELRTPLAAMITDAELSLGKEQSEKQYRHTLENILFDARKIAKLSNNLLDFAKANYDSSEIVFKTERIDEILLDACEQLQRSKREYSFNFNIEDSVATDDLLTVKANTYLLKVAFLNLLENACKFSGNHQCDISVAYEKGRLYIAFSDTGRGIAPENLERIFVPFYRGDEQKYIEGNGIGLSLTQKIISLHQGSIEVESRLGKGTVFRVVLDTV